MFILSLVSAAVGGIVTGTLRIAEYDARVTDIDRRAKACADRLVAVDAILAETGPRRIKLAEDLASIRERLSVIESQQVFVGDFIRDNLALQSHPAVIHR